MAIFILVVVVVADLFEVYRLDVSEVSLTVRICFFCSRFVWSLRQDVSEDSLTIQICCSCSRFDWSLRLDVSEVSLTVQICCYRSLFILSRRHIFLSICVLARESYLFSVLETKASPFIKNRNLWGFIKMFKSK